MTQEQIKKYENLNERLKKIQDIRYILLKSYPLIRLGFRQCIFFNYIEIPLSKQDIDDLIKGLDNYIKILKKEIEAI